MNFNVIGQIFDSSGYAIHTRNLANALAKVAGVRLTTQLVQGYEAIVTSKEMDMIKRESSDDEINLIVTNPLYWKHQLGKRNWAYLIFEGDRIPSCWIDECLNPDIEYILVPSMHTYLAVMQTCENKLIQTLIEKKVKIIPHGVDLNLFYPLDDKHTEFTFLVNKGWRNLEDRGGTQYAVKAFLEEFTNKDNVKMTIKINPAYGIPDVMKMLTQLKPQGRDDMPKVELIGDFLNYNDMVKIYAKGDVFVSPSRAEAFNIPCLEAMACGKPVITSYFGGQSEFVSPLTGWLVTGELKEVEHEILYEGCSWLSIDISHLRKVMREAYTNREEGKLRGQKGLEIARTMTWDHTAQKIIALENKDL